MKVFSKEKYVKSIKSLGVSDITQHTEYADACEGKTAQELAQMGLVTCAEWMEDKE